MLFASRKNVGIKGGVSLSLSLWVIPERLFMCKDGSTELTDLSAGGLVLDHRVHENAFIGCLKMHKKTRNATSERALMSFL